MGNRLWIFGGSPDTPAAWSDDGVQWFPLPPSMLNDNATSRVGVLVLVRASHPERCGHPWQSHFTQALSFSWVVTVGAVLLVATAVPRGR